MRISSDDQARQLARREAGVYRAVRKPLIGAPLRQEPLEQPGRARPAPSR